MKLTYMLTVALFTGTVASLPGAANAQTAEQLNQQRVHLPNGWALTPVGTSIQLGDLPLNMVVSPDRRYMAVTNNGQSDQSVELVDLGKGAVSDSMPIARSWLGLTFSEDGRYLYAAGGTNNCVLRYTVANGKLTLSDSISLGERWPNAIWPAGIAVNKGELYVVTKDDKSLYVMDLAGHNVLQKIALPSEGYACLLSPDKKELYITAWGADAVLVYDTKTWQQLASVPVGDNPNDACLTRSGKYMYVANSNGNSVSVIDLKNRKVIEVLDAALYPNAPDGSTTNSVALSADEKTLYAADADNNCLAVYDVSHPGSSKSLGFIPTGWYPTCVRVIGKTIYVANGKGFSSQANPYGPNPMQRRQRVNYQAGDAQKPRDIQYIAGLFRGELGVIPEPGAAQLAIDRQAVYDNTPYNKDKETHTTGEAGNPIPMTVGDSSPIKYVFYVIKENRTYDQVLGDMPEGNGDSSLVLFGEHVTPNEHAISRNFVLLDNFYVDAEVSADGHNWSNAAYATDYVEKTWPTSYGGRGGKYDFEGQGRTGWPRSGYIWDRCKAAGVSYRTYGEFADNHKANIPAVEGHFCTYYDGFDLGIRDTTRFREWERDFDSLVAIQAVPHFNYVRFGNDHTQGLSRGKPTPYAFVADNDLAVGMFIEHLSQSPIWNQTAVFILEDDAQNGPDHVDAHRSTAYVAGGFVKRHYVDHTAYSTSSMLRTIELILGMSPMSQYDAAATPMWRSFAGSPDATGYTALPEQVSLDEKNMAVTAWSRRSEQMDFTREDRVPDRVFNEILWNGLRGTPLPAPHRSALVRPVSQPDND
ncbi:MAG TPA: bifunctional YncE family protein/alkaline phosphatase family protein [Dinghuibacter sp.]|uniref:bifunctional YncE family protein/alkaline phosphatase family protein n=1 Tax=Dinghuibacter sp. TaxID=2024697 RepID=UPI002BEA55FF|nr:bifunctional YncE family protein/alkaline phosphatase family protein [Dinghuibacter sp.]HTJ14982.1 bifunctional YncE family protein/alkaline phosphatase family protein [Dinghuibacter sp.]